MRRAFYCLAIGAAGLFAAGYLADTARSDARVNIGEGSFSIERVSKGDRLPAFAAKAIRDVSGAGEAKTVDPVPPQSMTVAVRRPVIQEKNNPVTERSSRDEPDHDLQNASRPKKRGNKMMDGCEASVSPLSPASAQARASRCVA